VRRELSTDLVEILCQCYGGMEYFADGFRIVLSEIGNRILVRRESNNNIKHLEMSLHNQIKFASDFSAVYVYVGYLLKV
jgi:hypothetical protein